MDNNTVLGIVMISGGLVLALGGIALVSRQGRKPLAVTVPTQVSSGTVPQTPVSEPSQSLPTESQTLKDKGESFEKWVVKRFSPEYFTLKDWRGDKYVEGRYAKSSENPDLEIEFKLRDVQSSFAVECKWRKGFEQRDKPGIAWASERQITNYQQFAVARGMPVFVVIGIGGEPHAPAELYIAPLSKLKYPWASAEYLVKFRRASIGSDFFYEYKKPELR